ncbi:Fic family protein [Nannocystis radixulma]|uniref:Fic family protein n=1 Tax=Nannocystis radixulma TaxID=2995305 RepID=A0ABT5B5N4_9BACT|nr:Fic family protein [Nannocystis radixulma]MDC0669401.1 Fic family protein [Nannocystis radixulma]
MNPKNPLEALPEVFVSSTELSEAVSRGVRRGLLRQLAPKVYTKNLVDPPAKIVGRHRGQLVSRLLPGALVADRTALEAAPAADGSVFVVADRKRDIELPGLVIRPRRGPPRLESDRSFIEGLFLSSEARAFLDNMVASRRRKSDVSRTLSREELEKRLEGKVRHYGEDGLNKLRDEARRIAPLIGREAEFRALDQIVGSLLGTRDEPLVTAQGRARQAGLPFDPVRMQTFELLFRELRGATHGQHAAELDGEGRATLAFFEAYFSNYIEGTKFAVDEAADIVFRGVIPPRRPEDAHDVLGTWRLVSDPVEMARTPASPAELIASLKRRHAIVMQSRSDKDPGHFKTRSNQAGMTVFVQPELVEGTRTQGFDLYRGLDTPFARAVYMMFLIAEVHPFADGNGRVARIMMNAELVAGNETRILIPTVFRDDYISALKTLSNVNHPHPIPLVRALGQAQRWVAAVSWGDFETTRQVLARCHAFLERDEADVLGVRLQRPEEVEGVRIRR